MYICRVSNEKHSVLSPAFILSATELPQMPATGDRSALTMWLGMMLSAMAALAFGVGRKKSFSGK